MTTESATVVQLLWNYYNVLRDNDIRWQLPAK